MKCTLSSEYFKVGSILFSIVKRLKLYDESIGQNEHMITYALEIIKIETQLHVKRDELIEIVGYFNRSNFGQFQFNGKILNIPRVISTDKINCQVCSSPLIFYNDRKPVVSTLYDINDGSETVSSIILIKIYVDSSIWYLYMYVILIKCILLCTNEHRHLILIFMYMTSDYKCSLFFLNLFTGTFSFKEMYKENLQDYPLSELLFRYN